MGRRAFREKRSKFSGTKNVLQNLNQAAHAVVHDLDVSLPAGSGGTGYVLTWSTGTVIRSTDVSAPIYAPAAGTLAVCYASLPFAAIDTFEVDVLKNGTTIFTTGANRPKVTVGNFLSADAIPNLTTVLARDAFEVQVLSTGNNAGRGIVYIVVI